MPSPVTFSVDQQLIVNAYTAVFDVFDTEGVDSAELQHAYAEYIKLLKYKIPTMNIGLVYLMKYLKPTVDGTFLADLSAKMESYMTSTTDAEVGEHYVQVADLYNDPVYFAQGIKTLPIVNSDFTSSSFNDPTRFTAILETGSIASSGQTNILLGV